MARTDIHLDAMLRHLGAAYYESLHGRATRTDVSRALDTVEEHLHEQAPRPAAPLASPPRTHHADGDPRRRWARRVSDVMTSSVITVDRLASYQEIALMTGPAITIGPDATIPSAARLMNTHHIRRLPVVDADGKLVGIVSRRDLLSVFLRADDDIARDVRQILDDIPAADPIDYSVTVRHGVVTLTGWMPRDLLPVALRLIADIDGVVDVVNKLGDARAAKTA